jgi:hypothetical protein
MKIHIQIIKTTLKPIQINNLFNRNQLLSIYQLSNRRIIKIISLNKIQNPVDYHLKETQ